MATKIKFVLGRFLFILIGIFVALLCIEVALRILPVPNRFTLLRLLEEQWEPDRELLLHLKPNLDMRIYGHPEFNYTVRTNADGLRDEPFVGEFDIAAIGDSFTFGFGVEEADSWPSQLENLSEARVANLGWAGWNSLAYPIAVKRYAIPLKTRIWIWAFFVNDLPESAGAEAFLTSGETDYLHWLSINGQSSPELSFPFNLRTVQLVAGVFNPELFLLPDSGDRVFDHPELRMRVGHYAWNATDLKNPDVQRGWTLTKEALSETMDLARSHNAAFVVVFVPNREHVYWPYVQDLLEDVDIQQLDDAEARLAQICQNLGINYLNLLPGFQAQVQGSNMLYFPSDGHWNEAGHELAAELIHRFLLDEGVLEP